MLSIVEMQFGLLATDELPRDDLRELYTAAIATIRDITEVLPVYPRSQATLLQLANSVKCFYTFTAVKGLTQ